MSAACATCTHWQLRTSTLARHSYAPCGLSVPYTALGPNQSCDRHSAIKQADADKRFAFLANIAKKYNFGVTA